MSRKGVQRQFQVKFHDMPSQPFKVHLHADIRADQCKTKEGPSAEEWEAHRDTIIALYRTMPLAKVIALMKARHNFSATKNMYDKRFRQWGISKNMKTLEKEKLLQRIRDSTPSASHDAAEAHPINQKDLQKTLRYAKTMRRLQKRRNQASAHSPGSSERTGSLTPVSYHSPVYNSPVSLAGLEDLQLRLPSTSPSPSLSFTPGALNMELVLLSIQQYCEWQLENIPAAVDPNICLGSGNLTASTRFWSDLKNGIYLLKLSASSSEMSRRAFPAINHGCSLAGDAMINQPFDFLRGLFATLSPANTRVCPEVRIHLLRYLGSMACQRLTRNHPITLICHELQRDDHCHELSRRGLLCMLDIFSNRLGSANTITFKIRDSLVTTTGRNGELEDAVRMAEDLLASAREVLAPESDQVRTSASKLARMYMASGLLDKALALCLSVVRAANDGEDQDRYEHDEGDSDSPPPPSSNLRFFEDGVTAHTMEDIAEIYAQRQDVEECIVWLERASTIAFRAWGGSVATLHIVDKLVKLLRKVGRHAEADSLGVLAKQDWADGTPGALA